MSSFLKVSLKHHANMGNSEKQQFSWWISSSFIGDAQTKFRKGWKRNESTLGFPPLPAIVANEEIHRDPN